MLKKFTYRPPWGLLPATLLMTTTIILINWMVRKGAWAIYSKILDGTASGHYVLISDAALLWPLLWSQFGVILSAFGCDLAFFYKGKRIFNVSGALAAFACSVSFSLVAATLLKGPYLTQSFITLSLPGWFPWASIGFALLMAFFAYRIEQHRPYPEPTKTPHTPVLPDLNRSRWVYWESVRLGWLNYTLFLGAFHIFITFQTMNFSSKVIPPLLCVIIFLVSALFVGFNLSLTPKRLMLHLGWLRVPFLVLPIERITHAEALDFKLTTEFSGWGIRHTSKHGWGFIWGEKGIQLETTSGRIITISSEYPEELAGLLNRLIVTEKEKAFCHA